jgi:hypothetical protein
MKWFEGSIVPFKINKQKKSQKEKEMNKTVLLIVIAIVVLVLAVIIVPMDTQRGNETITNNEPLIGETFEDACSVLKGFNGVVYGRENNALFTLALYSAIVRVTNNKEAIDLLEVIISTTRGYSSNATDVAPVMPLNLSLADSLEECRNLLHVCYEEFHTNYFFYSTGLTKEGVALFENLVGRMRTLVMSSYDNQGTIETDRTSMMLNDYQWIIEQAQYYHFDEVVVG